MTSVGAGSRQRRFRMFRDERANRLVGYALAVSVTAGGFGTAIALPLSAHAAATPVVMTPAVLSQGAGKVDVFTRDGTTGAIMQTRRRSSAWLPAMSLGGKFATSPAAATYRGGIAVVAVTSAHRVSMRTGVNDVWGKWSDLGGNVAGPAALAASAPGQLEVFAKGSRGQLLTRRFSRGRWGAWTQLSSGITSSPAVVAAGPDSVALVAGRVGGRLYQLALRGGRPSGTWAAIPGSPSGSPSFAVAPGTLVRTLLVRGPGGVLYADDYSPKTRRWSGWRKLGGAITTAPAGAYWSSTHLEVLVYNSTRTLVRVGRDSGRWGSYSSIASLVRPNVPPPTPTTPPTTPPAPDPTTPPSTPPPPPTGFGLTGRWTVNAFNMPVRAMHAALMKDGRVLLAAGSGNDPNNFLAGSFKAAVWNPADNSFVNLNTPSDMFCSGAVTLPNGKVLVQGGTLSYAGVPSGEAFRGLKSSYVFDPATNQYTSAGNAIDGHWYPTLTKLENGNIWAAGGYTSNTGGGPSTSTEMFNSATSTWKAAGADPVGVPQTGMYWGTYPHMFLLADGRLFYTGAHTFGGPTPGTGAKIYNWRTASAGDIPGLRDKDIRDQAGSVLLPPAQNQTFLVAGGGSVDTPALGVSNKVDIINMNAANPSYTPGPDLPGPGRIYLNLTTMPDRTVLASNGSSGVRGGNLSAASIYNPATNAWNVIDPDPVGRNYHSTSVLLPDGRVAVFGSNPADDSFELRISIYEPPYLFRGTRPSITSAPGGATYGQDISLAVTGNVKYVSLTSPSTPTHQTDTNVRLVDLPIMGGSGGNLVARIPSNNALVPPGPYMLTVMDDQGVPSTASWITIQ